MTISMFSMNKIICVTNRRLCSGNFFERIREIGAYEPYGIILREKDLPAEEYLELAREVLEICRETRVKCILHFHPAVAEALGCDSLHMPLHLLREMTAEERARFSVLGASCHSVSDALEAEALGCTYITAGHIFDTDCKAGLPGRGLSFLTEVCQAVNIPVYAIGGISAEKKDQVLEAGAAGVCMMSALMVGNLEEVIKE